MCDALWRAICVQMALQRTFEKALLHLLTTCFNSLDLTQAPPLTWMGRTRPPLWPLAWKLRYVYTPSCCLCSSQGWRLKGCTNAAQLQGFMPPLQPHIWTSPNSAASHSSQLTTPQSVCHQTNVSQEQCSWSLPHKGSIAFPFRLYWPWPIYWPCFCLLPGRMLCLFADHFTALTDPSALLTDYIPAR